MEFNLNKPTNQQTNKDDNDGNDSKPSVIGKDNFLTKYK
jgi:hypothetical protein